MSQPITLALDLSDRTVGLHLGMPFLPPEVEVVHVPQRTGHRHERMLDALEWDACEFSLATYLMAREAGWPAVALPIFPRRMFSVPLLFVHRDSGLTSPHQLVGLRVGIRSFTTTLCVWGLGDLASVYGVPLSDIEWWTETGSPRPGAGGGSWQIHTIDTGDSLDAAFERGDLDAIMVPRVPAAVRAGTAVSLFPDTDVAMRQYFEVTGVFPIMHTIVVREEVIEQRPEIATELVAAFDASKQLAYSLFDDPNWCLLAGANGVLQSERAWLGLDPYPYGIGRNAETVSRLIRYERDLGLLQGNPSIESLFIGVEEPS